MVPSDRELCYMGERNDPPLTTPDGIKRRWTKLLGKASMYMLALLGLLKFPRVWRRQLRATTHKEVMNNFNTLSGGNNLLYRWFTSNSFWNVNFPFVDLMIMLNHGLPPSNIPRDHNVVWGSFWEDSIFLGGGGGVCMVNFTVIFWKVDLGIPCYLWFSIELMANLSTIE